MAAVIDAVAGLDGRIITMARDVGLTLEHRHRRRNSRLLGASCDWESRDAMCFPILIKRIDRLFENLIKCLLPRNPLLQ